MAVVQPVYYDNGHIRSMSTSQMTQLATQAKHLWMNEPSVYLSRVASGGNIGGIIDTRYITGTGTTDVTNFDTLAELPDIDELEVEYANITQNISDTTRPLEADFARPLYYDGNDLKEMSITDIEDTFMGNAVNQMKNAGELYTISTSNAVSGYTLLGKIFQDTVAQSHATTNYSNSITVNQSRDIIATTTEYFLLRRNHTLPQPYTKPLRYDGTDVIEMTSSEVDAILLSTLQHWVAQTLNRKMRFGWDTDPLFDNEGIATGTILNKQLDGTSTRVTQRVNTNDYRAQEVPTGSVTTADTYKLKIRVDL